ncbi:hypothetical protein AGMMS49982_07920 [Bacteroidia bacterium]|nr:hypothetical protein AGMMS49982_07920 [Bacteroidia bacterium]
METYEKSVLEYANVRRGLDCAREETRVETARNLLNMGLLSVEQVAQGTGLDVAIIQTLTRMRNDRTG